MTKNDRTRVGDERLVNRVAYERNNDLSKVKT